MTPLVIIAAAVSLAATAPAMGPVAIAAGIVGLLAAAVIGVPLARLGLRLGLRRGWQAVGLGGLAALASLGIGILVAWPWAVRDPVEGETLWTLMRATFLSTAPAIVVPIGMASAYIFWAWFVSDSGQSSRRRKVTAIAAVVIAAAAILTVVRVEQRGARRANAEHAAAGRR
jgi:hypothetical protein